MRDCSRGCGAALLFCHSRQSGRRGARLRNAFGSVRKPPNQKSRNHDSDNHEEGSRAYN
jgi:hypothetical protein